MDDPKEKKFGMKTIFTSGRNLKNLIYNNMSKLFPNSFPVPCQLDCPCTLYTLVKLKGKLSLET